MNSVAQYRIPIEVLTLVFDWFYLDDVVRSSYVCRHWRFVARAHPTYGRVVHLTENDPQTVALFLARLGGSTVPLVDVKIRVRMNRSFSCKVAREILATLSTNMHRIAKLELDTYTFPEEVQPDFESAFAVPASSLTTFKLSCFSLAFRPGGTLPPNIFACHAPCLRVVDLEEVYIRYDVPLAFSTITDLSYASYGDARNMSQVLFEGALPQLARLHIRTGELDRNQLPVMLPPHMTTLQSLTVDVAREDDLIGFGAWPPCADLAHVQVQRRRLTSQVATIFLTHLAGDVRVSVERALDDEVSKKTHLGAVEFAELGGGGRARSFGGVALPTLRDFRLHDLSYFDFRVVELHVPFSSLRYFLPWAGAQFAALARLSISAAPEDAINSALRQQLRTVVVACPRLGTLTLSRAGKRASPAKRFKGTDLRLLLREVFRWDWSGLLRLELDGLELDADGFSFVEQWSNHIALATL